MAVMVQAGRPQITNLYVTWQLRYRRTGHRSQYNKAHASNGTVGQATDHIIIKRMAVTVQAEMPQITK